jgi:chemotaxis protein methyltransferase CheR
MAAPMAAPMMAAASATTTAEDIETLEVELLLEALHRHAGHDFRGYERGGLRRRLHPLMQARGLATVSALQDRALHDAATGDALLRALGPAPSVMFEDPAQARELREVLAACLSPAPLPRVWLAECAGAEEAWSLAILLHEEGLAQRSEIFATCANEQLLAESMAFDFPAERLAGYAENHRRAGGNAPFADYFEIAGTRARLLPALRARITWAQYNLVTDASFNEFQLIVCRRALLEFDTPLRRRVMRLFHDSLARFGVLGPGRMLEADEQQGGAYRLLRPYQPWYQRIA